MIKQRHCIKKGGARKGERESRREKEIERL
jgi:hypothetical protein